MENANQAPGLGGFPRNPRRTLTRNPRPIPLWRRAFPNGFLERAGMGHPMLVPDFVLRKLYQRGSLRETGDGRFRFTLQNPLGDGTITAPPRIVVNGISYTNSDVRATFEPMQRRPATRPAPRPSPIDLQAISRENPLGFAKGQAIRVELPGRLLRGGNRIHITVETREFGEVEVYVEDREAEFCDLPGPPDVAA